MEPLNSDWKLFRRKISTWQETYMEKLVMEYTVLLNDDLPASTKFWEIEKRIKQDKKRPGVLIDMRRSQMVFDIFYLINDGVITFNDLEEFSEELREQVKFLYDRVR